MASASYDYMPMFYFHLRTPRGLERDEVGIDIASAEAAYLEAARAIPDLAVELLRAGESPSRYTFEVRNEVGQLVWEIGFHEVLGRITASGHPTNPPPVG